MSDARDFSKVHAWRPGVLRRMPWAGILCLSGVLCCVVVEACILAVSNGADITSWKYPPSLYLSVAYTLGNILLSAAFSNGLTIYWWRTALKEGTQLGDLHRCWAHGTSAVSAALAGKNSNFISFAALFLAVTPINGPLLQRASSTTTANEHHVSTDVDIKVPAAKSLQHATGHTSGRSYTVTMLDSDFSSVVQAWNTGQSIIVNSTGCASDGVCSGTLTAAGLAVSCNHSSADFDLLETNSGGSISQASFSGLDIFSVELSWSALSPANITLDLQYKPTVDCSSGKLSVRNCTIGAATVAYPVEIDGAKSTIELKPKSTIYDDKVDALVEYYPETMYGIPSPIGGYAYALSSRLGSSTHMSFAGAAGFDISSEGALAAQFANQSAVTSFSSGLCAIKFTDPTDYILDQARQLMFRTALAQGNVTTMQDIAGASEIRTIVVYHSHFEYLGAAVALTVLAMLIVMLTFNEFWLLGRNVSMSPIETAKAFNAPLLAQEHPNAEVRDLVEVAGSKPVRYGQVVNVPQDALDKGDYAVMDTIELCNFHIAIEDPENVQPLGKRRTRIDG